MHIENTGHIRAMVGCDLPENAAVDNEKLNSGTSQKYLWNFRSHTVPDYVQNIKWNNALKAPWRITRPKQDQPNSPWTNEWMDGWEWKEAGVTMFFR